MATSTIFNFNFNNSEIVDSTGQWYNATTGTPTTEFIEHDGNTALFQPAKTNGDGITPNPTILRSYDPNFSAYTYTLEVQVCAVLNRTANSSFILNFPIGIDAGDVASALGLWYNQNDTLEMWIDYASEGYTIHPVLIDFSTAGFDRWFSVRIERTVDPNNPYIGATVKAYVDGAEVYNQTFTYAQSTIRGMIGPRLRYCENLYATGGVAIDNLKLTAGIAPSSVVDVSLANLQRNNANLLSFIKGKVPTVNDGTLTIQKNGTNVATFTANQSTNATANITVPTAVSELTNDSGYLTSSSNLDASKLTSGTVDIERLPQGALERLVKVANEAARYALTIADVQLGDTVQQLDTGIMYVVTDTDHLDSAAGYTEYTAGTAASVPWSGVTGKPTFAAVATSGAYSDLTGTPTIPTVNNATLTIQRNGTTIDTFTANASVDKTINISTTDDTKIPLAGSNAISGSLIPATTDSVNLGSSTKEYNNAYIKSLTINGVAAGDILTHNASDFIPRDGGAVLEGMEYKRTVNNSALNLYGGRGYGYGAFLQLTGIDDAGAGEFNIQAHDGVNDIILKGKANGTLIWNGQPIQTSSDQRLKQQITEIDDKLLDAWEDVDLVQFKYNDAVKEKSDNARLHTGYVVQQIDSACKEHGVDISAYGLYCHEEYPQETEEVEIEQADGTKVKETKVIREASEHYSLRYTEALIVECKYLRRCIARLTARIEELEKGKEQEASK